MNFFDILHLSVCKLFVRKIEFSTSLAVFWSGSDGTVKHIDSNGDERAVFPNGTIQLICGGETQIDYPNGRKVCCIHVYSKDSVRVKTKLFLKLASNR